MLGSHGFLSRKPHLSPEAIQANPNCRADGRSNADADRDLIHRDPHSRANANSDRNQNAHFHVPSPMVPEPARPFVWRIRGKFVRPS
jgi:hypothetical protein